MIRVALIIFVLLGVSCFSEAQSAQNVKVTNPEQEIKDSRYYIVVGSFSSATNAANFGRMVQAKGHEVYLLKNAKGFSLVGLYPSDTERETKSRLQELKTTDELFKQAWVFRNSGTLGKISTQTKPATKPRSVVKSVEKPKTEIKIAKEAVVAEVKLPEKVNMPVQKLDKVYLNYCIVVGNFTSAEEAKKYGETVEEKGFGVYFRKDEKGAFNVCLYNLKTEPDAVKRLDKMKHIDGIFYDAVILGYDSLRSNLRFDQL